MANKGGKLGVELLRALVNEGYRIFTINQARQSAQMLSMNQGYVVEALYHLKSAGWIRPVKRGVYAITEESGFASPPHDYEIAMALVSPCAISHWTAFYHHHMTQQIPQTIFALTPTGTRIPSSVQETDYHFVHIKPARFFGIEEIWVNDGKVNITDPERTLLDGLLQPKYCGGIQEVLGGFDMYWSNLDLPKIIDYALRLEGAVVSRLGWVLEQHGCSEAQLKELYEARPSTPRNLDASGPTRGSIDKRWKVRLNIGV